MRNRVLRIGLTALVSGLSFGQPSDLRVEGVTSTQAVLSYMPPSAAACGLEVAESASFGSAVNDLNGILFPGSNSDAGRAITAPDGRRTVVVGTRRAELGSDGRMYSRALRADRSHFVRVTCGSAATAQFVTGQIHGIAPEGLPYREDGQGSFAFPDRDLSTNGRSVPVVDPQTGAATFMVTSPKDYSHVGDYTFSSGVYFGGSGWSNPGNITSGTTGSTASTSSTNPIFIPVQAQDALIFGNYGALNQEGILVDLGLHVFGRGSGSATDRQVQVCLSVDSGQSCYTNSVNVTMPTGNADVGVFPSAFPTVGAANAAWAPFVGWGRGVPRHYIAQGQANIASGVLTVTSVGYELPRAILNPDWAPGSKVFVAGSSPTCANNYCTIVSVQSGTSMTLAETGLNLSGVAWRFHGLGFRIVKTTSTGSVNLSASYKLAKSYAMEAGPDTGCSPKTVTTNVDRNGSPISPGIVGRLCVFNRLRSNTGAIYFVGETVPEFRLISLGRFPTTPPAGYDNDKDWVFAPALRLPPVGSMFDPDDPNTVYVGTNTNDGSPSIFKGVYSGDYREASGLFFVGGNDTGVYTYVNDGITWTNVTRKSLNQDLRTRILASSSGYNESLWGSLAGGLTFAGIADHHAVFYRLVGPQDGPCWVFTFDARTGAYVTSWNTVAGGGAPGSGFGGCHSVQVLAKRVMVANNGLRFNNASLLYGGPFTASPTHLYRSGAASTNTALPSTFDGSYDGACPDDIDSVWKNLGAIGNRCLKLRFATEPCSGVATAAEKTATPCPGDPTKSFIGTKIGPGAEFFDTGAGDADSEHFLVVKRTDLSGNSFEVVVMRNAGNSYCCLATPDRLPGQCVQIVPQTIHASGWTGSFLPRGSCTTLVQFTDPRDASSVQQEISMYVRGHFSLETNAAGQVNFAGVGGPTGYQARFSASLSDIGKYNAFGLALSPSFGGAQMTVGTTQSYISPGFAGIAVDWRHPNGSFGQDIEIVGQTIGPVLTITAVAGQSSTYKVTGFPAPVLKAEPLMVWAGRHTFGDMSSSATGDVISDANPWKYCYVYRANECRNGSAAGELYVSAPKLNVAVNSCNASQVAQNILCVLPADPLQANVIQMDATMSDVTGSRVRRLGLNLTNPGAQYVYSHARPFSGTQPFKLFATQYNQGGIWTGAAMLDPGGWNRVDGRNNDFVAVPVEGGLAGSNQARVRFGYVDYGTAGTNFYCTTRAEDCVTDAAVAPYAFAGDTLTPTACSGSCRLQIPAIPGRVLVYRVEHLNSGVVTKVDPLQVVAVP